MIKWRGRTIKDFVTLLTVMNDVRTEEDAKTLREACDSEFGDKAKIYLGFMTAYFKPVARRAELCRLLDVKHPLLPNADSVDPPPELAMRIGLAQCLSWVRQPEYTRDVDLEATKFSDDDRTPGAAFEERRKSADWNF